MSQARRVIGIGLLVLAAALAAARRAPAPAPDPGPAPSDITLRGVFTGPTAAEDAAQVSAMWLEVADEIEHDGLQAEPFFKTGHSLDVLRTRARELRWRGQRIAERQPAVQAAAHDYLDQKVGTAGGEIDNEQRAKWVNAYRSLGRAAADASR